MTVNGIVILIAGVALLLLLATAYMPSNDPWDQM